MTRVQEALLTLFLVTILAPLYAAEELQAISVTDTVIEDASSHKPIAVETDATTLMERVPGGGVHSNGAISGQT